MSAWLLPVVLAGLAQAAPAPTPDDLLEAVRHGDLAGVRRALDAGVPVDTPFRYDRTALSFAADRGNADVVRLLLERGADPNKKDSFYGATAMTWAIEKRDAATARLLVEHGFPADAVLLALTVDTGDQELVALALEKAKLTADDLSSSLAAAQEAELDAVAAQLVAAGAQPPKFPDFPVEPAVLASYAGIYRGERDDELRIELREGRIVCASCGPKGMAFGPEDAVTFRTPVRRKIKLVFTLTDGKPSGCVLDLGNRQLSYRRVADIAPGEKP